jgi:hypothetical protein
MGSSSHNDEGVARAQTKVKRSRPGLRDWHLDRKLQEQLLNG